jgi:hypothetical protein
LTLTTKVTGGGLNPLLPYGSILPWAELPGRMPGALRAVPGRPLWYFPYLKEPPGVPPRLERLSLRGFPGARPGGPFKYGLQRYSAPSTNGEHLFFSLNHVRRLRCIASTVTTPSVLLMMVSI